MYYKLCSSQWRAVYKTYMLWPPHKTALKHLVKFISGEEKNKHTFTVTLEIYLKYVLTQRNIYLNQDLKEAHYCSST